MTTSGLDTETNVHIQSHWRAAGDVAFGRDGKLPFPRLPAGLGFYEFQFAGSTTSVYVGESENLHRRMSQYRDPGPSQRTNIRINDRIRRHLDASDVTMAIATKATVRWSGTASEPLDLANKVSRVLGESVGVLHRKRQGHSIEHAGAP